MNYRPSLLYTEPIRSPRKRIEKSIQDGLSSNNGTCFLFFRADDIGVRSQNFTLMAKAFTKYRLPLDLAVVPSWINSRRLQAILRDVADPDIFRFHQHGWLHKNYQAVGKKQEFGNNRTAEKIELDIVRGKKKLESLFTDSFHPIFTPPWNRCSDITLQTLKNTGFLAVSRSKGATPLPPSPLKDIFVNVDLHTRKEKNVESSFTEMLFELQTALSDGHAGIMLHHQKMNEAAFHILDLLLYSLKQFSNIRFCHMAELADS